MIVTTYICDRCKAEQPTREQMWYVSVLVSEHELNYTTRYPAASHSVLWCRACCGAVGVAFTPPVALVGAPDPTIEDFIREIVRNEVGNQ
jgi:hypothetical protein